MTETDQLSPSDRLRATVCRRVNTPVDIASLAAFRILFGLLMAGAMIRFLAKGWVDELYVQPGFHFPYDGFGWVHALPGEWMHAHFVALAILALMVAGGIFYRATIILFCLGFTYVELIDQTAFLNHYYLISLLSGIMIFLPAHRAWSVDAWRKPSSNLQVVPAWTINLLRFQVAVVYLFAGLAKVNADWLLRAQPLRIWLAARSELPVVGDWLQQLWVAYTASWLGAFYDLTIVFFLLRPRTRKIAFLAVVGFHVGTWLLFHIGMFPWIMIAATTVFFSPDWARVPLSWLAAKTGRWLRPRSSSAWAETPSRKDAVAQRRKQRKQRQTETRAAFVNESIKAPNGERCATCQKASPSRFRPLFSLLAPVPIAWVRLSARGRVATDLGFRHPRLLISLLVLYGTVQVLLPLRPYLFGKGHPAWSYRGFNLAWQVMVAEKTGYVEFYARDPATGRRRKVDVRAYLTPRQEQLMAQDPYLIQVLARKIGIDFQARRPSPPEITVNAFATLNGRPSQRLINPSVDLSGTLQPGWIFPLQE